MLRGKIEPLDKQLRNDNLARRQRLNLAQVQAGISDMFAKDFTMDSRISAARIATLLTACAALVMACEDGPTQTFTVAPTGAASQWNDGKTPPVVDNSATQGFQTDFAGGSNKQEICTGEQRAKRWAAMMKEPIVPAFAAAGVVGVGADLGTTDCAAETDCKDEDVCTQGKCATLNWKGMTVEQAELVNCQSETLGDQFGDGSQVNSWGDNAEVWIKYNVANHNKLEWISVFKGYDGLLNFTSRDGKDKFSIHLGDQITKNGKKYQLDWNDPTKFAVEATEIADGLFATYAKEMPAEDIAAGSCVAAGRCTMTKFPDVAALRIWPLGMHMWITGPDAPQPTPSKFDRIDLRLPRVMPYTFGSPTLKLDADGPTTKVDYPNATNCDPRLGMTWKEFTDKCVNINQDPVKDKPWNDKLLGNITHGSETFVFDTSGVDLEFQSKSLAADDVVRDADRPKDPDIASGVYIDAETLGKFQNDWSADGAIHDLHGSGAVMYEFARSVQAEINAQLKAIDPNAITHDLGDPACLWPDDSNGVAPNGWNAAANCTGFEGVVTAMPAVATSTGAAASVTDVPANRTRLGPDAANIIGALGLKPGKPIIAFCMDANGSLDKGYYYCGSSDTNGLQGAVWDTSFQRVRQVLGKGELSNLPPEMRDRRFYYKMYVLALLKYFIVAGDPTKLDLSAVPVDTTSLFFDSEGSGQYEFAEYIDRRFVTASQPPLDLVVKADILNGTFYDYDFERKLYRDESAVYSALTVNPTDPLGKENDLTITNVFGSPVLANAYANVGSKTAYDCATADWTTAKEFDQVNSDCQGQLPPLDSTYVPDPNNAKAPPVLPLRENGKPILTPYKGAFTGKSTAFTLGSSNLTIEKTMIALQSAQVKINHTKDPYDPASGAATPLEVLVEPWAPPQPGYGFAWPVNGQQDKIVTTGLLDFSGVTTDLAVWYSPSAPAADGSGPITILAVDSASFLGDVFLCQDPLTGDLLRTRMYGSISAILDWIDSHPGVYDACGLIVRYSPYNNYPDYIISQTNGVKVGVTPGGGFGRVNDALLWLPGQY